VGIIQTVEGHENSFHQVEWISVIVFTFEYIVRIIGVGADPEYARDNGVWSRLKYVVSFYSIVDLLAILPFYLSVLFPGSWFDQHDEYL
jgi:voltage-gated potassium channel